MKDAFADWQTVKNYSPRTVKANGHYLGYYIEWSLERGITQPLQVTKIILERYQRHLFHYRKRDGNPLAVRGQLSRLYAIKAFFKWATRNNRILYNPAGELELPRKEHRLPKVILNLVEVERVLAQPDTLIPNGVRDRAMLEILYSTGMRRMELIGLEHNDVDYQRGTVTVRGKGNRDRVCPIGVRALNWLHRYLDEVRPDLVIEPDPRNLFLQSLNQPFKPDNLSKTVTKYIDAADINKSGSCHLFRHTCATLMHENGADIRFIQQLLGHASLETTQIYTQVSIQTLKNIHKATHPAENRDKSEASDNSADSSKAESEPDEESEAKVPEEPETSSESGSEEE